MQKYYFNSILFGITTFIVDTSPDLVANLLLFLHTLVLQKQDLVKNFSLIFQLHCQPSPPSPAGVTAEPSQILHRNPLSSTPIHTQHGHRARVPKNTTSAQQILNNECLQWAAHRQSSSYHLIKKKKFNIFSKLFNETIISYRNPKLLLVNQHTKKDMIISN